MDVKGNQSDRHCLQPSGHWKVERSVEKRKERILGLERSVSISAILGMGVRGNHLHFAVNE